MKYNIAVGIPETVTEQLPKEGAFPLWYTNHAIEASKDDRYARIVLPSKLYAKFAKAVEVETNGDKVYKTVYRIPYNEKYDLVMVVLIPEFRVKTVWLNRKDDLHDTLKWGLTNS